MKHAYSWLLSVTLWKKTHDLAHFDYKRSETWLLKYTRRLPLIGPAGGVSKVTT